MQFTRGGWGVCRGVNLAGIRRRHSQLSQQLRRLIVHLDYVCVTPLYPASFSVFLSLSALGCLQSSCSCTFPCSCSFLLLPSLLLLLLLLRLLPPLLLHLLLLQFLSFNAVFAYLRFLLTPKKCASPRYPFPLASLLPYHTLPYPTQPPT